VTPKKFTLANYAKSLLILPEREISLKKILKQSPQKGNRKKTNAKRQSQKGNRKKAIVKRQS